MTSQIRRILIANRGEIARRVIRTARAMGIQTVAVYSEPDADAPFVREADMAIPLRGSSSAETYLDSAQILDAVRRSGADAVHPGYGFLSENPSFAEAVTAAGVTWIGPTPESIRAMALKVEAKRLAAEAGVPLVPGAELPEGADAAALADQVGYPLLVKASAGGGGKGMRVVESGADLGEALESAPREAQASFGDPTVFLERYLTNSRHVEVQVFGDVHGNVVHLGERECSIQRRHQKIVEESPSPGLSSHLAQPMYHAAVSLARAIGYVGAGTVEFIVAGEDSDQEFYFLEMNTRLQVEHPVTEMVTGIDLVEWQIRVARGETLPLSQEEIARTGHAIEVRLYAEDPARGYLPNTGTLHAFAVPDSLRVDSGVEPGSEVSAFYDPMLAKVIAHAPDRITAAQALALGLRGSRVHGLVTNRDSLVAILESSRFLGGDTTTAFLDREPTVLAPAIPGIVLDRHGVAIVSTYDVPRDGMPAGWRNVPAVDEHLGLALLGGDERTIAYRWTREGLRAGVIDGAADPHVTPARELGDLAVLREDGGAEVVIDGVRARCQVARYGDLVCVDDGLWSTQWRELPRFADLEAEAGAHGPSTPVPGTVTVVAVAAGDRVTAGQTLVVLEAMKMEHRITADTDGVITEVLVTPGQSVDAHAVVAVLATEEES
ncbi:MAG: acetyl/propionyl/methylcrotonyl-CoA carboxylase subunit alpha [Candidatus Nanopelagicales bacterium]